MTEITNGYGLWAVIVQAVASLAWPASFAFAAFIFRAEIAKLLPNLHIRHGESELSFRRATQLVQQVQEHEATKPPVVLPSTATSNLSGLSNDELRLKVEDVALRMREMQSRFNSQMHLAAVGKRTHDRESWAEQTRLVLEESDRRSHEWQTTLLPEAAALREELKTRLGDNLAVDTGYYEFVFEGSLAGVNPLNAAAMMLEQMARNLTGPVPSTPKLVQ